MKYRALDKNGDYKFGNNDLDYIDGVEAIAQAIKTKILLFYGEWWENLGEGIPMFEAILGQTNQELIKQSASLLLTQRIKEVEGVSSVDSIETIILGRSISFVIKVTATTGEQTTLEVNI